MTPISAHVPWFHTRRLPLVLAILLVVGLLGPHFVAAQTADGTPEADTIPAQTQSSADDTESQNDGPQESPQEELAEPVQEGAPTQQPIQEEAPVQQPEEQSAPQQQPTQIAPTQQPAPTDAPIVEPTARPINTDGISADNVPDGVVLQQGQSLQLDLTYYVTTPRLGTTLQAELQGGDGWLIQLGAGGSWSGSGTAVSATEAGTTQPNGAFGVSLIVTAPTVVTADQTVSIWLSSTSQAEDGLVEQGIAASGPLAYVSATPPPPALDPAQTPTATASPTELSTGPSDPAPGPTAGPAKNEDATPTAPMASPEAPRAPARTMANAISVAAAVGTLSVTCTPDSKTVAAGINVTYSCSFSQNVDPGSGNEQTASNLYVKTEFSVNTPNGWTITSLPSVSRPEYVKTGSFTLSVTPGTSAQSGEYLLVITATEIRGKLNDTSTWMPGLSATAKVKITVIGLCSSAPTISGVSGTEFGTYAWNGNGYTGGQSASATLTVSGCASSSWSVATTTNGMKRPGDASYPIAASNISYTGTSNITGCTSACTGGTSTTLNAGPTVLSSTSQTSNTTRSATVSFAMTPPSSAPTGVYEGTITFTLTSPGP